MANAMPVIIASPSAVKPALYVNGMLNPLPVSQYCRREGKNNINPEIIKLPKSASPNASGH